MPRAARCNPSTLLQEEGTRGCPANPGDVDGAADRLAMTETDLDALIALVPSATLLGVVVDEATAERVIAAMGWATFSPM